MKKNHVVVRRLKKEDIEYVIGNIRDADKREIEASTGKDYRESLKEEHLINENSWTGLVNGEIVMILGIKRVAFFSDDGIIWMFSTKNITKYSNTFIRHCKKVFNLINSDYKKLFNFVDDRNTLCKFWLKWMGFKLDEPIPYGIKQLPFRYFYMEVKSV